MVCLEQDNKTWFLTGPLKSWHALHFSPNVINGRMKMLLNQVRQGGKKGVCAVATGV